MTQQWFKLMILSLSSSLVWTLVVNESALADPPLCTERIDRIVGEGPGNEVYIHFPEGPNAPDCFVEYHTTPNRDFFTIGAIMPRFISNEQTRGKWDVVQIGYPHSIDFSQIRDLDSEIEYQITYGRGALAAPFSMTIRSGDGFQTLRINSGEQVSGWTASDGRITWYAGAGDDRMRNGDYTIETVYGGPGNDIYIINNNDDRAIEYRDEGYDVVSIRSGAQNYRFDYETSIEAIQLEPGASVDRKYLPPGVVFIDYILDGRDWLESNGTYIPGTAGNDVLYGSDDGQTVEGKGGNDYINSGGGNDSVQAGDGNDLIVGGSGEGNDTYNGGPGVDTVKYTSAKAAIIVNLLAKKDQARSVAGGDAAGIGVDQLSNIENVTAGYFNDQVSGNTSANILRGEKGNDVLKGDKGKDTLIGGLGADSLYGGPDADKFAYSDIAETDPGQAGSDTIFDFDVKTEKIDLSAIDASAILDGNNAFMFKGGSAIGTSTQGEVSVVKIDKPGTKNDFTMVYIDNDADPDPEGVIRLKGLLTLTAKNFVL